MRTLTLTLSIIFATTFFAQKSEIYENSLLFDVDKDKKIDTIRCLSGNYARIDFNDKRKESIINTGMNWGESFVGIQKVNDSTVVFYSSFLDSFKDEAYVREIYFVNKSSNGKINLKFLKEKIALFDKKVQKILDTTIYMPEDRLPTRKEIHSSSGIDRFFALTNLRLYNTSFNYYSNNLFNEVYGKIKLKINNGVFVPEIKLSNINVLEESSCPIRFIYDTNKLNKVILSNIVQLVYIELDNPRYSYMAITDVEDKVIKSYNFQYILDSIRMSKINVKKYKYWDKQLSEIKHRKRAFYNLINSTNLKYKNPELFTKDKNSLCNNQIDSIRVNDTNYLKTVNPNLFPLTKQSVNRMNYAKELAFFKWWQNCSNFKELYKDYEVSDYSEKGVITLFTRKENLIEFKKLFIELEKQCSISTPKQPE